MRKIRKRIFAVALAAVMLFNIPGTGFVAAAETAETDWVSGNSTEQVVTDAVEESEAETSVIQELEVGDSNPNEPETGDDDTEETETDEEETLEEESPDGAPEENEMECICEILCTGDSINEDCPVCGAEDADLSCCKGAEENTAGYYSDGNTSGFRPISEILAEGYALKGENGLIEGTATGRRTSLSWSVPTPDRPQTWATAPTARQARAAPASTAAPRSRQSLIPSMQTTSAPAAA